MKEQAHSTSLEMYGGLFVIFAIALGYGLNDWVAGIVLGSVWPACVALGILYYALPWLQQFGI